MANLIIKPTATGELKLQNDAGNVDALTVSSAGALTAAGALTVTGNATLSGTGNNIGTVTAGTIENPPGGVTQKAFGFSAYLSTAATLTNATWVEASAIGTWTERWDTDSKFASGRFTPTIQGLYLCGYATENGYMDDNNPLFTAIRKNGSSSTGDVYAFQEIRATGADAAIGSTGSSIIQLDTNDYVSYWINQGSGGNVAHVVGLTEFWGIYMGQV